MCGLVGARCGCVISSAVGVYSSAAYSGVVVLRCGRVEVPIQPTDERLPALMSQSNWACFFSFSFFLFFAYDFPES
jgi:hypothetical protein